MDTDTQPQYPIRAVARRTGLSPHVLRAWERRYGVVEPARSEGGDRLYSSADIFRFRLLKRLTDAGHAIGRVAALPTPELLALQREEEPAPAPAPPASAAAESHLQEALLALEEMNGPRLYAVLMRAVVALSSADFREQVVAPLLRQVGELWSEGRICPAHEHVLSAQLVRVLGWLLDAVPVPAGAPEAVATTPAGQRHEFGAMLASVVAAEEGWRVTYLGPDLPAADVALAARVRRAPVVLVSVVLEDGTAADELSALCREIGAESRVLVGGRGAAREPVEEAGCTWLPDLAALRTELRAEAAR